MKKIFLLVITVFGLLATKAQVIDAEKIAALQLVNDNLKELDFTAEQQGNYIVSSTYKNKFAGTTMVYLQQTHKNVLVYNQIITLAFKGGKIVSRAGKFINNIDAIANLKSAASQITALDAVKAAAESKKLKTNTATDIIDTKATEHKVIFGDMGISRGDITAKLMWFPSETGKLNVKLGWQIYIVQNNSSDYWLINIDATNKKVLGEQNLTVYCNFDANDKAEKHNHNNICTSNERKVVKANPFFDVDKILAVGKPESINSPTIVNTASYRVIPFPAESPLHPGGTNTLVLNPWELCSPGNNATTLKWHSVGATNYDITRGNNVWAQEDRDGLNSTNSLAQVTSATAPDPLKFDFIPDFTVDPLQTTPIQNQQFNVTNLFYWNNIIHDLTYQYGFDEAARNFQGDNMGRGGLGGDFVMADAQDGSGTNNANFSAPADGGSGRMQMYMWTAPNPDRDGDVDNGVVVHEYGHGISNRLTGNGDGCLGNLEQMGEGWSDYYCLMYTQNWATSTLTTGFDTPRGIGTYANNQGPTGGGIRTQRYCTNFAVNNRVYATTIPGAGLQHSRGEIWCATLWDMTWNIINQVGSINTNLFNANAAGGNSIALKLVTEGMKLQPCSPGFIDGRDGILQADQILYGGAYRCAILEAFRRRGMALGASQGLSTSVTDQIPSFTNAAANIKLLQNGTTIVPEGQNISYINRVTADPCVGYNGFTITDTLPTNVTYISGGTYNAATRVVSFSVTQAAGTTVDYPFVVKINAGTYFAPLSLLNEPVPAVLPGTWTATTTVPAAGGTLWAVSTVLSSSAPNAFYCNNETISTDKRLELNIDVALSADVSSYPKFSFKHRYNTEDAWDGGVIEISTNGGTTWTDLGTNIVTNKYDNLLGAGTGNNLSNRKAFTGLRTSFINSVAALKPYAGQNARVRFRFASDDNTSGVAGTPTGWFVDDVTIADTASVYIVSNLFNGTGVKVISADTVTQISAAPPVAPVIVTQPANTAVCVGSTATFSAAATGAGITYTWEVSTNGGTNWNPVSPAVNTSTLTLTNVTAGMNNNRYRLVAGNTIGSVTTTAGLLTVTAAPSPPLVVSPLAYCSGVTAATLTATGTNLLWYTTITGGTGSGTAPTPSTAAVGGTTYYVSQSVAGGCESVRAAIVVNVTAAPAAPTVNTPVQYCVGAASIVLSATGTSILWYTTATGGTGNSTAPTPSTAAAGTVNYYVSQTAAGCESPRALIAVITNLVPTAPAVTTPVSYCQGATAIALTAGTGANLKWYIVPTNGTALAAAPIPVTTTVGTITYYVSQANGNCEGPRAAIVVNVTATPIAPSTTTTTFNYCVGNTATVLTATGTNLLWYTAATGGTGNSASPTPSTTAAGSIAYYVSQTAAACESPRTTITVNVNAPAAITTQPTNITTCSTSATLSITATGTVVQYQWQLSTDGGTVYNNIATATTSTLVLNNLTPAQATNKYRVVLSSPSCNNVTSNAVSVTVGTSPVVTLTASPSINFNPYTTGVLTATVNPTGTYTYLWKRDNTTIANTTATLSNTNGLTDAFGSYQVTATDASTGCSGVSNAVTVVDVPAANLRLLVSPNPTRGLVKISYNGTTTLAQPLSINMFDSKGARVFTQVLSLNTAGNYTADINIKNLASGTYLVALVYATGSKIATEKLVKF
jgi:hypothetical protein